jgi:hypothetical protein
MKGDQFRDNARNCDEQARNTLDPALKKYLEDLACDWRDMADQVEQESQDR